MANPLSIAARGKGFFPMLARGFAITNRYGFTSIKIDLAMNLLSTAIKHYGGHATIPITASVLSRNKYQACKYQALGFELAVHGYSHIDYRQQPLELQIDHLQRAIDIFKHAGINPKGFRSPYLLCNSATLSALSACGFEYDSSQALYMDDLINSKVSSYQRALEFYRAQPASQYPCLPRFEAGGLVRIPYCLPDDESLIERMKITDVWNMEEIWLEMLGRTYDEGELFTLGLHPERAAMCCEALESVLIQAISYSHPVWIDRLDNIVAWYKSLGKTTFQTRQLENNRLEIEITAPPSAIILIRSFDIDSETIPWINAYRIVKTNKFSIQGNVYPIIGLSPACPESMVNFLKHQGYLVDINTHGDGYSYYLDSSIFSPEDERRLLVDIEKSDFPLARIWRWPNAARSALSITGDIDAFTIWDYGRRFWQF